MPAMTFICKDSARFKDKEVSLTNIAYFLDQQRTIPEKKSFFTTFNATNIKPLQLIDERRFIINGRVRNTAFPMLSATQACIISSNTILLRRNMLDFNTYIGSNNCAPAPPEALNKQLIKFAPQKSLTDIHI